MHAETDPSLVSSFVCFGRRNKASDGKKCVRGDGVTNLWNAESNHNVSARMSLVLSLFFVWSTWITKKNWQNFFVSEKLIWFINLFQVNLSNANFISINLRRKEKDVPNFLISFEEQIFLFSCNWEEHPFGAQRNWNSFGAYILATNARNSIFGPGLT